jgi:choline dehydrogenase-like flavoprotein
VGPTTPDNLTVVVNHQCTRVILTTDKNGEKLATGIEVRDNATSFPATYTANKEIVLSCGAYNTPQLLMLSGIGPKMHLEKFRIPVEVALEGVGQNLQDHIINFNFFQVTEPRLT